MVCDTHKTSKVDDGFLTVRVWEECYNSNDDFWSTYNGNEVPVHEYVISEENIDLWFEVRGDEKLLAIVKDISVPNPLLAIDTKRLDLKVDTVVASVRRSIRETAKRKEAARKGVETRKRNKQRREEGKLLASTIKLKSKSK